MREKGWVLDGSMSNAEFLGTLFDAVAVAARLKLFAENKYAFEGSVGWKEP